MDATAALTLLLARLDGAQDLDAAYRTRAGGTGWDATADRAHDPRRLVDEDSRPQSRPGRTGGRMHPLTNAPTSPHADATDHAARPERIAPRGAGGGTPRATDRAADTAAAPHATAPDTRARMRADRPEARRTGREGAGCPDASTERAVDATGTAPASQPRPEGQGVGGGCPA